MAVEPTCYSFPKGETKVSIDGVKLKRLLSGSLFALVSVLETGCSALVTTPELGHVPWCAAVTFVHSEDRRVADILSQSDAGLGGMMGNEVKSSLPSVYDGPPVAMYSGGAAAVAAPGTSSAGGTVFDETKFVAKGANASVAVAATTKRVQRSSFRFFFVAGLALFEFFALSARGADQSLLIVQGVVVALFGLLGLFAYRLNKTAFLVGMLVYGLSTLLLVYTGWQTSMLFVGYAIFVRCTIIYRLYLAYGMICDLES